MEVANGINLKNSISEWKFENRDGQQQTGERVAHLSGVNMEMDLLLLELFFE